METLRTATALISSPVINNGDESYGDQILALDRISEKANELGTVEFDHSNDTTSSDLMAVINEVDRPDQENIMGSDTVEPESEQDSSRIVGGNESINHASEIVSAEILSEASRESEGIQIKDSPSEILLLAEDQDGKDVQSEEKGQVNQIHGNSDITSAKCDELEEGAISKVQVEEKMKENMPTEKGNECLSDEDECPEYEVSDSVSLSLIEENCTEVNGEENGTTLITTEAEKYEDAEEVTNETTLEVQPAIEDSKESDCTSKLDSSHNDDEEVLFETEENPISPDVILEQDINASSNGQNDPIATKGEVEPTLLPKEDQKKNDDLCDEDMATELNENTSVEEEAADESSSNECNLDSVGEQAMDSAPASKGSEDSAINYSVQVTSFDVNQITDTNDEKDFNEVTSATNETTDTLESKRKSESSSGLEKSSESTIPIGLEYEEENTENPHSDQQNRKCDSELTAQENENSNSHDDANANLEETKAQNGQKSDQNIDVGVVEDTSVQVVEDSSISIAEKITVDVDTNSENAD